MIGELALLVSRQVVDDASEVEDIPAAGCEGGNEYDGRLGVRISAIFVILITASLGACFPVYASRHKGTRIPSWAFFIAKYFGSGIIIATAFIHLLAPAHEALTDPCLTGPIVEYPWVEGIALMTIFVLFFIELLAMRYSPFSHDHPDSAGFGRQDSTGDAPEAPAGIDSIHSVGLHPTGQDRPHSEAKLVENYPSANEFAAQMTAIFILEFGVIFHSVFIGLTLAVAGPEFKTLYIVLVFHQTFEGLGLGSRLAAAPWPKSRQWTPYLLGVSYGLSTPIAIAIGLGVRETFSPGSEKQLLVNGIFDSISAGILIYTGLVELMAHEFMFSSEMQKARLEKVLAGFATMCVGAGLMALLGRWA